MTHRYPFSTERPCPFTRMKANGTVRSNTKIRVRFTSRTDFFTKKSELLSELPVMTRTGAINIDASRNDSLVLANSLIRFWRYEIVPRSRHTPTDQLLAVESWPEDCTEEVSRASSKEADEGD